MDECQVQTSAHDQLLIDRSATLVIERSECPLTVKPQSSVSHAASDARVYAAIGEFSTILGAPPAVGLSGSSLPDDCIATMSLIITLAAIMALKGSWHRPFTDLLFPRLNIFPLGNYPRSVNILGALRRICTEGATEDTSV